MKNRAKRGFTLIETLVVVAIIGILAALYLPVLAKALRKAKEVSIKEASRQEKLGRMADSANSGGDEFKPPPGRAEARAAFSRKLQIDSDEEINCSEMLYVVRTDDEFKAYFRTLLDPTNTAPIERGTNGYLVATNGTQTFFLPPMTAFPSNAAPAPQMWESISTDITETTSGTLGAIVLYTDGHVDYARFPGVFPMTQTVAELTHEFLASP